jgi:hypothetical protein
MFWAGRLWRTAGALLALPLVAHAEPTKTIDHARILLGDVIASAPEGLADLDLGPAPPPGSSRLLTKTDLERELRQRGVDVAKMAIPSTVRVVGAARRIAPEKMAELARPYIEKELPPGVMLTNVRASYEVVVPPAAEVKSVHLPKILRQKGTQRTTVTIELVCDGTPVAKVPVTVVLEVSEQAARPDLARQSRLNLSLERGAVKVSTVGQLLADANIGESARMLVVATGRVVEAKILSRDEAKLVEGP